MSYDGQYANFTVTGFSGYAVTGTMVPEPGTLGMILAAGVALAGYGWWRREDLLAFLYVARGSAGEVRSMLHFAAGESDAAHLKSQISDLTSTAESCSRQIRGWADSAGAESGLLFVLGHGKHKWGRQLRRRPSAGT